MKNKKFTALLLACVLMFSFGIMGCSKKVTAQECAQVLWDMNIKHDKTNISKIGLTDEDAQKAIDNDEKLSKSTLKQTFTTAQIKFNDAQVNEVYNALLEAFGKMNVKIDEVSNDGKTAQIKYTASYFDITSLDQKAATDAIAAYQNSGITDEAELLNKKSDAYIKNLINNLKSASPSTDTREKTYTFVKQGKVWLPQDTTNFGSSLGKLISGQ